MSVADLEYTLQFDAKGGRAGAQGLALKGSTLSLAELALETARGVWDETFAEREAVQRQRMRAGKIDGTFLIPPGTSRIMLAEPGDVKCPHGLDANKFDAAILQPWNTYYRAVSKKVDWWVKFKTPPCCSMCCLCPCCICLGSDKIAKKNRAVDEHLLPLLVAAYPDKCVTKGTYIPGRPNMLSVGYVRAGRNDPYATGVMDDLDLMPESHEHLPMTEMEKQQPWWRWIDISPKPGVVTNVPPQNPEMVVGVIGIIPGPEAGPGNANDRA